MAEKYSDYIFQGQFFGCAGKYSNPKTFCCEFHTHNLPLQNKKNWGPPTIRMTSIQSWLLNVAPCLPKKTHAFFTSFALNGPQSRQTQLSNMMSGSFCLWSMLANIPYTDGMGNTYSWILWSKLCNKDSNHITVFLCFPLLCDSV